MGSSTSGISIILFFYEMHIPGPYLRPTDQKFWVRDPEIYAFLAFWGILGHREVWEPWVLFFKTFFFLMWNIFKVFIEFVTILLLFYVLILLAKRLYPLPWKVKFFKILPCRSCHGGPRFSFWISAFPGFLEALCSTVFCFGMTQKRESHNHFY